MLDMQQEAHVNLPSTAEEFYARIESLYGRVVKIMDNSMNAYSSYEDTSIGRIEALNFERSRDLKTKEPSLSISIHLTGLAKGLKVSFEHTNVWALQEDSGEWVLIHAGTRRDESFFAKYGVGGDISVKELLP